MSAQDCPVIKDSRSKNQTKVRHSDLDKCKKHLKKYLQDGRTKQNANFKKI